MSKPEVHRPAHRWEVGIVAFVVAVIQLVQKHRDRFGGRARQAPLVTGHPSRAARYQPVAPAISPQPAENEMT